MNTSNEPLSIQPSWFRRHRFWTVILGILLLIFISGAILYLLPFNVDDTSVSNPARSHEEAISRVEAIQEEEKASGEINPVCYTNVLSHGQKTDKVIVFYHGFTSCPEQFRELGEAFYDQGYNIFIPRMPHHGHADQMSEALLETSSEELAAFATETIDIGKGLGDEVIVGGLSGGGTIATWVAQEHSDIDKAVLVAPFLGIGFIPTALNRPVAQLIDDIPNIWMWWDPGKKADNPNTASYAYPRYPLHALAEYLRLGFAAQKDAASSDPGVKSLVVITNANDESVNNGITYQLLATWSKNADEILRDYEFDKTLKLPHDLITPTREDGNPALVYPVIIDYLSSTSE